jgi:hypothetical protein
MTALRPKCAHCGGTRYDHGGGGASKGNRNALKHGLYGAEAVKARRMIGTLIRQARELAETV